MASPLTHFISSTAPLLPSHLHPNVKQQSPSPGPNARHFTLRCCASGSGSGSDFPSPSPLSDTTIDADRFPIEKRRRSTILRDRRSRSLTKQPEPPNMEIGWKRTKEIDTTKPKGYVIMDFLEKLEGLMERQLYGSTELLEKTGEIVAERAREEAEVLRDEEGVEERLVTELFRVLRLMEMDLAMVRASVKEETLKERLEQAKARCRQAILVANSF